MSQKNAHPLVSVLIGLGSAAVGLFPWIVTGARLPLQNLGDVDTDIGNMPIVGLPFSQYLIFQIVAVIVIGAAVAGIVARNIGGTLPILGGVLLVQVAALVQTAVVTESGLRDEPAADLYLLALVAGTVAAILLGVGMLLLIARAPKAGALLAFALAGVALSSWLTALFFPISRFSESSPVTDAFQTVIRYAPAIVVGAAIVWCGLSTVGRIIAAGVSVLILWVAPTVVTAVSAAVGSRILLPYPAEMLDYGVNVFRSAIVMPEIWGPPIGLAVAIAVVGLVARRVVEKRRAA